MRTFTLYKNDVKQTWSVIKNTLQTKLHSTPSSKFISNNNTITDLDEIATEFNNINNIIIINSLLQTIVHIHILKKNI